MTFPDFASFNGSSLVLSASSREDLERLFQELDSSRTEKVLVFVLDMLFEGLNVKTREHNLTPAFCEDLSSVYEIQVETEGVRVFI